MDADPFNPPSDTIGYAEPDVAALRQITTAQLLDLGKRQMAYLKPGRHDGEPVFILCRADGTPIIMVEDTAQAARAATHLSLELNAVH